MNKKIGITGWGSISAVGHDLVAIKAAYQRDQTYLRKIAGGGDWVGNISAELDPKGVWYQNKPRLRTQLDRSVLLSFLAADQLWPQLNWSTTASIGINIGSSRGATHLWESHYQQFEAEGQNALSPLTSPTTTLGNISSWLGAYLEIDGPNLSHSVTCSTGLQSIANAVAWLESGRCQKFIAGGSEAPLTPFTIAQMKALRIYAAPETVEYPCRSLDGEKSRNSMVLGEGAAIFALESKPTEPIAWILGMGLAQELPDTPVSVSSNGAALQRAMRQALHESGSDRVDLIICHAPGTRKGDAAELEAIHAVFGTRHPLLCGNKWKIGHTLGASGALSLEMALLMLQDNCVFSIPFLQQEKVVPSQINSIMINAMGFGGNAMSLIVGRIGNFR